MRPMRRKNHDENEAAARVIREATKGSDELPETAEAAWADWARRIHGLDERTRTLCRAAFEAGAASANAGRVKGAKAGGAARAASLTDKQRKTIAKKGADARWGKK